MTWPSSAQPAAARSLDDKEKAALSQLLMSGQSQFNPAQVGAALIDRTEEFPIYRIVTAVAHAVPPVGRRLF